MYWTLTVLILCSLLLVFLLWKEYKRPDKAWLLIRVLTSTLSVACLVCLAFPFSITTKQSVNTSDIVLLTQGFSEDSVQKIIKRHQVGKIYTVDKNVKAFNAIYLPDITTLKQHGLSVHVVGDGLTEDELSKLGNTPISFHPSGIKNNFKSIAWNGELTSGESLLVQGSFVNSSSSATKIVLSGLGANLDSVMIAGNQTSGFQLTAVPPHIDKAVYSITALSGKDSIVSEPLPIKVNATEPLRIFVLASSPDFENKFLKNWLSENGYQFAVKTIISANKYDREYVNLSSMPLDRINSGLLENFDLVIADMSALTKLPSSDLATMRNYIASKGLGLIVKADSLVKSSAFYAATFPLVETRDSLQHIVKLNFRGPDYTTSAVKVEQPIYIRNVAGTQPLVHDQQMRIVANSAALGLGKLIVTTFPNTYSWQLSGNRKDYSTYWTTLLTKSAKKRSLTNVWSSTPAMPSINEEVHLQLQTPNESIPQVMVSESAVSMEQDIHLLYKWTATYWPVETGWQTITNSDGTVDWWYVYGAKDWVGVKAMEKMEATKEYANSHKRSSIQSPSTTIDVQKEVPKIYFLALFIVCCGVLWFEKKLHNR